MTQERANEIVRKVIYARLNVMPKLENSEDAFHVGRMIGQMQRQLEIELSLEVDKNEEYELVNLGNGMYEKRYKVKSKVESQESEEQIMAKFPTYEEMSKKVAEKALDEFLYNGKSIREWMQIIVSEDAINRKAVLEIIEREEFKGDALSEIEKLPPVIPQPKMGRWIKHDTGHSIYYDCSLCSCVAPCTETANKILWKMANYCPDCGAKMQEVKE